MSTPTAQSTEVACAICLTIFPLPETLPFREDPRCPLCLIPPRRYLPCVACERSFDPYLPACPTCGERPPDEAITNPAWHISNRVLAETMAALRPAASASAPAPAAKPAESAPKRNGNGNGRTALKRTVMGEEMPVITPRVFGNGNGAAAQGESAESAGGEPASDSAGSLFGGEDSPRISVAGTLDTEYELIEEAARLAEVVASLSDQQVVAVDTETTGLDPFADNALLLVQVATTDHAYLIDARKIDPRPLRRILEDPKVLKLLQNAKFDYKMLRHQAGISLRNMYDTMLVERVLTAGISREIGLAKLAQKYAGITLDKSVRRSFIDKSGAFSAEQLRYAARDAQVLFTIYAAQRDLLKRERLLGVASLEFKTVIAVSEMELAGCLIDQGKWRKIIDAATAERDRTALELGDLLADAIPQLSLFGGPAINLNSNAQLVETFKRMGIDLPDTMEATLTRYDHPAVKKLIEYRGFEKMISAFGEKFLELIHPKTGRIHPDFNQLGADTGRFSCTNPNVQQIPSSSDFRSCFTAAPGYKLITCDYSQAELRILAQLSEDPAFVAAFQSGGDLHQLTASQMYQIPPDQVTKQQRGAAKVINFGLAYGRGPAALGVQLGISSDEARGLIDQYFKAYAGIQRWLERAGREAVRKGYSTTMMGRKRYYPPLDPTDEEYNKKRSGVERQGKNSPIQGCLPGHVRIHEQMLGYVPIASLCGRQVSVWDGHQFVDAMVMASGPKQLVRVTLWGGHYIECSPDHRFLVRDPNGRFMWKTPCEFKPQHRVMLTEGVPSWSSDMCLPDAGCGGSWNGREVSLSRIADPTNRGEWLGRLASDGSIADGSVRLMVAEHEESLLPRLHAMCAELGHVGYNTRVTEHQPRRFHNLNVSSRGLVGQLRTMGVKTKIPESLWHDSQVLAGYLRGLFDGDGTVSTDGALLVFGQGLTHLEWAREVQQALLLFGIRSRIRSYAGDRTVVQVLKKDMPVFAQHIGFMNPIKQEKASRITADLRESTYGRGVRVRQVEVTDTWVEMYDVVNSSSGRFMANGLIVHNSNADMTKLALIGINEALQDYEARIVNTVHDEIVVEAREDQAEVVCGIVEREMVKAGEQIISLVPIVADAKVADYWSK